MLEVGLYLRVQRRLWWVRHAWVSTVAPLHSLHAKHTDNNNGLRIRRRNSSAFSCRPFLKPLILKALVNLDRALTRENTIMVDELVLNH